MECQITILPTFAKSILEQCAASCAYVHSVYRKTINLKTPYGLLALQIKGSPVSPISLITDQTYEQFESYELHTGDRVEITSDKICIKSNTGMLSFSYSSAKFVESCLNIHQIPEKNALKNLLLYGEAHGTRSIFAFHEPEDSTNIDLGFTLYRNAASNYLAECKTALLSSDLDSAVEQLLRLIGLGIGLTPSGDDFLCGFLAGLYSKEESLPLLFALTERLKEKLHDTNEISAAFLNCALQRHYSQPVCHLFLDGITSNTLSEFTAIGHSSGMDTLYGLYYSYIALQNDIS